MSGYPVAQRDCFRIPSGPGNQQHLFVVLTDPAKHDGVLLVNATSCHPGVPDDPSCYLHVGDHPFIRHQSYVLYSKARYILKARLSIEIASQNFIPHSPQINPIVFARVLAGIVSPNMDPNKRAFAMKFK